MTILYAILMALGFSSNPSSQASKGSDILNTNDSNRTNGWDWTENQRKNGWDWTENQ